MKTMIRWFVILLVAVAPLAAPTAGGHRYWKGRPAFSAGKARGYFLWNDAKGWHLRWTNRGRKHVYSGTITCDGRFMKVKAVSAEKKDFVKRTRPGTIRFDSMVRGGMDGLDFRLSPSTRRVTFDLTIDGRAAPAGRIAIGLNKRHPAGGSFTLKRPG